MTDMNTCWFCKQAADPGSTLVRQLYMETGRSLIPRKVEYKTQDVIIPRCQSCKGAQTRSGNNSRNFFGIGIIAGVFIGHFVNGHEVIGAVIGGAAGMIAGMRKTKTIQRDGVLDDSNDTLKSFPDAIDKIKEGWTFNQPFA